MIALTLISLTLICLALIGALVYQQRASSAERAKLLTRIQAPEMAVAETLEVDATKEFVSVNDDEGFWAAQEEIES